MNDISKRISALSKEQIKVEVSPARPPEKSNEIYSAEINGEVWVCERPKYHFSILDQSLWSETFLKEGELLFDKVGLTVFDKSGLWWSKQKLGSKSLVRYFLDHPSHYLSAMADHYKDVLALLEILKEVNQSLDDEKSLSTNLRKMARCYQLFYRYPHTIFWVSDELIYQFRTFLMKYLDKKIANIYLTQFLTAEMTKEVISNGYGEKLIIGNPDSRGALYASDTAPIIFYRRPKFFHSFDQDMDIVEEMAKGKLTKEELKDFFSFRMIVPVAVQVNEEAQYIESQMLSSHTSFLIKKISERLKKSPDELEQMSFEEIIDLLERK